MLSAKSILIINIITTLFMVGVIWLIQILNYPLFAEAQKNFNAYHQYHMRAITFVIALPMILEAVSAFLMLWFPHPALDQKLIWLGVVLILIIWLSTIFLSVPNHETLMRGFDANAIKRLVQTNWIRTIGWTLRGVLVTYFLSILIRDH